jgi:anionic cell wall polymer biosynthesis LytR-Cps2A-Psr (LCP) family protein
MEMRKAIIVLLILFVLSACGVPAIPPQPTPSLEVVPSQQINPLPIATSIQEPEQEQTPVVSVERYNFLLLGGDYRHHRKNTGWGDKTDAMLLVSFLMSDSVEITVLQFPRNLYEPVIAMDDQWLFNVFRREGYEGLHYYFQEVFDIPLQGIAYVHMDNFTTFVDALDGLWIDGATYDGEAVLAYLRDNDNNWGCYEYDCGNRQFKTLIALAEKIKTKFHENAWVTTTTLWDAYGYLFETDLADLDQLHWLVDLGWHIATSDYIIRSEKLTSSDYIIYGDTPLEVRGWIKSGDLKEWARLILEGSL